MKADEGLELIDLLQLQDGAAQGTQIVQRRRCKCGLAEVNVQQPLNASKL